MLTYALSEDRLRWNVKGVGMARARRDSLPDF
jgi:hypothetical protein